MIDEPDNHVLQLLRNIGADVADVRSDNSRVDETLREVRPVVTSQGTRFDASQERVEMLREGTLTPIGFATNAAQSQKKLQEQIADLAKRVEKLEQAQ
jgi:hypothetical protein